MKNMRVYLLALGLFSTSLLSAQALIKDSDGGLYEGLYAHKANDGSTAAHYNVKEGKLNGEVLYYFPGGKIREKGQFLSGQREGKWVTFGKDGKIVSEAFFKNDKPHGTWLIWDENGNLRFEMHYRNGEKTGIWKMWDEAGRLMQKRKY